MIFLRPWPHPNPNANPNQLPREQVLTPTLTLTQVLRGELIFASASSGLWKEPTSSDPTDAWTFEGARPKG